MPVAEVNPQRRELINRRHDARPTDSWHRTGAHRGRGQDYYHGSQPDHSIERSTGSHNYHRSIDHQAEGHWSQARSQRSSRQDPPHDYRSQNPANGHWRQQHSAARDGSGNGRPNHRSLRQRLYPREPSPQKPAWQQLSLSERSGYASTLKPEEASPTTTAATTCDASTRPVASLSKPDEVERRVRDLPLGHDKHEPWSIRQISSYETLLDMAVEESGHDHKSKTMRAIAQSFSERGLGSDLSARALDIVYDLCEDTDPETRRIGYSTLVSISQTSSTELVRRNADVLLQILGNGMTAEEHRAVSLALVAHLELGCIGLLKFLLQQTPAPSGDTQDLDPYAVLLRFLASYGSEVVTLVDAHSKRIRGDAELEAELLETLTSVMPLCNLDGLFHLLGLVSHFETIWLPHRDFLSEQTFQRSFRALRSFFNALSSELAYAVSPSLAEQIDQATEEPNSPAATGHDLLDSTQTYLANLYDSVSLSFAERPEQEDLLASKIHVFIRSFLLGPKTRGPAQERPLLVSRSPMEVLSAEARIVVARATAELAVEISPGTGLDDLFVGLTAAISSLVPLINRSTRDEPVGVLVTLSDAAVCEALLVSLSTVLSRFTATSEEPGLPVDMGLFNSIVFRRRLQNLSGALPHGTTLAMKTSPSRSAAMPYNVQLLARHLLLLAEQKEPADGQAHAISALVPSWKVTDGLQSNRDANPINHISMAIDGSQEEGELSSRVPASNGNGPSAVKRQRLDNDDDEIKRPHSRDDDRTTLRTLDGGPASVSGMTQSASPAQQPPSGPRNFTIRGRSSLVASSGLFTSTSDPRRRSPVSQRWVGEQGSLSGARESTGSLSVEPRDVEQHGERVQEGPRAPADFRMHPDRVRRQWQSVNGGHNGSAGYHSHGYRDNRRGGGGGGYHRHTRGRY